MAYDTLVVDNGGWAIKAGWAGEAAPSVVVPNTTARIKRQQRLLVADETESKVKDTSQLVFMRPVDRGYVTDTFAEGLIWERLFSRNLLNVREIETKTLLLTAAPFMPSEIAQGLDELAFETFKFGAFCRAPPAQLAAYALRAEQQQQQAAGHSGPFTSGAAAASGGGAALPFATSGCGVVVDSGFSFSHVTPIYDFGILPGAVRRLNVGGKLLTNHLKEQVSYRQWNMMDMGPLVNAVKERLCFVALQFDVELEIARRLAMPGAIARATSAAAAAAAARAVAGSADGASGSSRSSSSSGAGRAEQHSAGAAVPTASWSSGSGAARGGGGHRSAWVGAGGGSSSSSSGASSSSSRAAVRSHALARPRDDGLGIGYRREYVLPDYSKISRGFVRGGEDDPAVILKARGVAWQRSQDENAAAAAVAEAAEGAPAGSAAASAGGSGADGVPRPSEARGGKRRPGGKKGSERGGASAAAAGGDDEAGRGGRDSDVTDTETESGSGSDGSSFDSDALSSDDDEAGDAGSARRGGAKRQRVGGESSDATAAAAGGKRVGFVVDDAGDGGGGGARERWRGGGATESKDGELYAPGADGLSPLRRSYSAGSSGTASATDEPGAPAFGSDAETAALAVAAGVPAEELQILVMNHERFAVPEALFRPADIGLPERGLPEVIAEAIAAAPRPLRPALWSSIVLTGGNARLPGFEARLQRELRALAPAGAVVQLYTPPDPVTHAWGGGSWWASADGAAAAAAASSHARAPRGRVGHSRSGGNGMDEDEEEDGEEGVTGGGIPSFRASCVTRAEWQEEGPRACARRFRLSDPWLGAQEAAASAAAAARRLGAIGSGGGAAGLRVGRAASSGSVGAGGSGAPSFSAAAAAALPTFGAAGPAAAPVQYGKFSPATLPADGGFPGFAGFSAFGIGAGFAAGAGPGAGVAHAVAVQMGAAAAAAGAATGAGMHSAGAGGAADLDEL